jgi:hypothetical protein
LATHFCGATTDQVMIEKASSVGERIRKENGVDNALNAIHYNHDPLVGHGRLP